MEPEDRSDQTVLVEVSKKDVTPEEGVIDPETSSEAEVISHLEEFCTNCHQNPISAKGLCKMCRYIKYQNEGRW